VITSSSLLVCCKRECRWASRRQCRDCPDMGHRRYISRSRRSSSLGEWKYLVDLSAEVVGQQGVKL
jgi:hypothetical protein